MSIINTDSRVLASSGNISITTYIYLDIIACTVNLVICCQASFIYSERYLQSNLKTRSLHLTGFVSSMCGIIYSLCRLTYWFIGTNSYIICVSLLLGGGGLSSIATALSLLHIFLRANMINRDNNKQWKICRVIALFAMLLNVVSFSVYLILRYIQQIKSSVCVNDLNKNAFIIRDVAQTVNHIVQTSLFIYPLVLHIRQMQNVINTSDYNNLIRKVIIAMSISTLYTIGLLILVGFYTTNATIAVLLTPLSILDIALIIGSVCYGSTNINKNNIKRRSSILQTSSANRRSSYTPSDS